MVLINQINRVKNHCVSRPRTMYELMTMECLLNSCSVISVYGVILIAVLLRKEAASCTHQHCPVNDTVYVAFEFGGTTSILSKICVNAK